MRALEDLFDSILRQDLHRAEILLGKEPELTTATLGASCFFEEIPHWLYAGDTALHLAAASYSVEIARLLLESGANPNSAINRRRGRPLHYACDGYFGSRFHSTGRQVETISLLITAGADIDAQDANGATGLHRAVRTRSAEAVKFLLDRGADPLSRNHSGSTPFHLAVQNTGRGGTATAEARTEQRRIIAFFLERGVDPAVKDGKGKSIVEVAAGAWVKDLLGDGADQT